MSFPISAALLDAIVLSVVSREGTYGYKITPIGRMQLMQYLSDWADYRDKIESVFFGGSSK